MAAKGKSISELRSLGPKSQALLAQIGIRTRAELTVTGAVPAYVQAKRANSSVSLNLLYGLVSAIEDCDWREVQRTRKLELLNAVEDYERLHPTRQLELKDLRNIGQAMLKDFALLKIRSVAQLAECDADDLYERIQKLTHTRHDPCVWDTYAAAIHQSKTGEALDWWEFTKQRKARTATTGSPKASTSPARRSVRK